MYWIIDLICCIWQNLRVLLILIGLISVVEYIYENFKSFFNILCAIIKDLTDSSKNNSLKEKFGEWAVITGSTDGLGKAYALELARYGINIVLIARSEQKLNTVAQEIRRNSPVQTKCVVADFSQGPEVYANIKKQLEEIPVTILVNNVGQMYEYPQELATVPEEKLWSMVLLNVGATVMMTRIFLNKMKIMNKGAIVNIGSITQLTPGPYYSVYAASKIFVKYFTLALQKELANTKIAVQLLNPAFIATNLTNFSESLTANNFLVANVRNFAESAVYTLGKSPETSGCVSHGIQFALANLVPTWVRMYAGAQLGKYWNREYRRRNKAS